MDEETKKVILITYKKLSNELITALNKCFRMIIFDPHLHFSKDIETIGAFDLLLIHLNMDSFIKKNTTVLDYINRQNTDNYNVIYIYKHINNIEYINTRIRCRKLELFTNKKQFYRVVYDRIQEECKGEHEKEEISVCSIPASPRSLSINVNEMVKHHEAKLITLDTIEEIQNSYNKLTDSLLLDNEAIITVNQELKEQQAENKDLTEQYISVFQNLSETKELLKSQSELINSKENEIKALKEQFEKLQKNNQDTIDKISEKTTKIATPAAQPKRRIVRINTSKDNLIEVISDTDIYSFPYIEKEQKSKALAEALRKKSQLLSEA